MSFRDWLACHGMSWRMMGLGLVVALAGYMVLQPSHDNVARFFRLLYWEVAERLVGYEPQVGVPRYTRDLTLDDLKKMLGSKSPSLQASAVKAIGERSVHALYPNLIPLLNDVDPLTHAGEVEGTSVASLSRQSLTRMTRDRIKSEPANVGILVPLFSSALKGTLLEREAVIHIIGSLEEPLGVPFLFSLQDREHGASIKHAAQKALDKITSDKVRTDAHTKLKANQVQIVLAMTAMTMVLLGAGISSVRKGIELKWALFPLVPILLCVWLVLLVATELHRGRADFKTVASAIAEANPATLRALHYQDPADFPGDSYIAHYLVATGNVEVIRALTLLALPDPDDLDSWKVRVQTRNKWIMARILASNLNASTLEEWLQNGDPRVRLAIVRTLGELMIRHDAIVTALKLATNDEDDGVRTTAMSLIPGVEKYPIWNPYAE